MRRLNCDVAEDTFRKVKGWAGENGLRMPAAVDYLLRQARGLPTPSLEELQEQERRRKQSQA